MVFYGIDIIENSNNNLIYNNIFKNSLNAHDTDFNDWNITKTSGTNIIGGPFLGGNFWSDYNGTDTDGDGLGNTEVPYNSNGNITNEGDFLPLIGFIDLNISSVQITQAIQNATNPMPMIRKKPTVVRAVVENVLSSEPVPNVTGILRAFVNGNELPGSPLAADNEPITVPSIVNLSNIGHTLNFKLPFEWTNISSPINFTIEVNPNLTVKESDFDNNLFVLPNQSFINIQRWRIAYIPVNYTFTNYVGPNLPNFTTMAKSWDFLYKNFPIGELDYFQWPIITFNDSRITSSIGQHALIQKLNIYYATGIANGLTVPDQLYGYLPGVAWMGGHADMPKYPHAGGLGIVGIGTDESADAARIMAHELAHSRDAIHGPCAVAADGDWPFPGDASIRGYGFDVIDDVVIDPSTPSYMSYCEPAWTDTFTYDHIFQNFTILPGLTGIQKFNVPQDTLMISGTMSIEGVGKLSPIFRLNATAIIPPSQGLPLVDYREFTIELQNSSGGLLSSDSFVLYFGPDDHEIPDIAFFNFMIPHNPNTDSIVLKNDSIIFDIVNVSANVPMVSIVSPNGGEIWSETQIIEWTATDLDGDSLTYMVLYSTNNGTTWMPLAVDHTNTELSVNTGFIPGSETALIRVLATDGVNTGEDRSDTTFSVTKKSPTAVIITPDDNQVSTVGQTVFLIGLGIDLEDESLDDNALEWTSSLDGSLGFGKSINTQSLSEGVHTITLTVVDSDDNIGTDSITLFVGSASDSDADLVLNENDNCPLVYNP